MQKMVIPCEVYSRVVGYYRPVSNWNNGKKQEFSDRMAFMAENSLKSMKPSQAAVPIVGGGTATETIAKVFSFPNCDKCDRVKAYLKENGIQHEIVDLKSQDGSREFRKFYSNKDVKSALRRTDSGELLLPIVLKMAGDSVVTAVQTLEDTKSAFS